MPGSGTLSRWRFLVSPKWLGWHAIMIVTVAGMLLLGSWQFHRAQAGNALSWGYTFEWPLFAIFAVVFWLKTIRDEVAPPAPARRQEDVEVPGGARPAGARAEPGTLEHAPVPATPEDEELAAYNAYLARLHREVRGHGKWHGLR